MKTKKLFYVDPYLKEFDATVLKIIGNKIILDLTAFYPKGGGQVGDTGIIGGMRVLNTQEEGEDIMHILEQTPEFKEGETVHCLIDWDRRYRIMCLHSASHITWYFVKVVCGSNETLGSNVDDEKDRSTYVLNERIDEEKLKKIEEPSNKFIEEHDEILTWSDKENPNYRYWKCGEIEMPCGGTHVKSVKEIKRIKCKRKTKGAGKELLETYLDW